MNLRAAIPTLLLASASAVLAQQPDAEAVGDASTLTLLDLINRMGIFIWPLGALSIIAVFLIVFYFLTIRRGAVVSDRFMNSADALIRKQDYLGLLAICQRQSESISQITRKALDFATKNPTSNFDGVREVIEAEGSRQSGFLNQRISYLADVGAIAPMVGLLGTVVGMIGAFDKISQDEIVGVKQMGLAEDVSLALLTTAGGLVIGIPSLIFYAIFRGRVQGLVSELEAATTHIVALLGTQYNRAVAPQPQRAPRSEQAAYAIGDSPADLQGI